MSLNVRGIDGPWPVLQAALDFVELDRALRLAGEAAAGGVDWLEAGTPLIKSEGFEAVRRLRAAFPGLVIVADLKTMDAGRVEFEAAAYAGAQVAVVLAAASDSTIGQCVEAGRKYGLRVYCDTINIPAERLAGRVAEAGRLGVDIIGVHVSIDDQMRGGDPLARLRIARAETALPLAVAGGVTSETAPALIGAGADIVIVGGALHKAENAREAARALREALDGGRPRAAALGKRVGAGGVREALLRTSTSNLSDAMHHRPCLAGPAPRTPGLRMAGPAQTVRTAPGDWNKVVQAIDLTPAGGVLVADAGGVPPAVFGELAAQSALNRGLAGVVVHGGIRDVDVSTGLGLPIFSTLVCSHAGEPKGFGEIGTEIAIGGQAIRPGDWIFGDDDGVMALPEGSAAEYANRALDVAEAELRLAAEIRAGRTLSEVANLKRWEKR
ncbi:MAG: orotidine 5'-phosphate decarboxylase [Planctomycetota bacterium]|jgi:3-hexulose-6-phosphate synthase/6-phospho-3-hexuloisomerase|nr:orotidine 5'-phosphate decarboxylase [Planctomycetota bacterium]